MQKLTRILAILLMATTTLQQINLNDPGYTGVPLNKMTCNTQTIINFKFNSSSIVSDISFPNASFSGLSWSNLTFLDRYGNELFLTLSSFSFDSTSNTTGFVTNYATPAMAIDAAAVFLFNSGIHNVYVYIPFTTIISPTYPDLLNLTSPQAPSNSLDGWDGNGPLSPFNFFDNTDYNQWYTAVTGTNTVLVSKFVYRITSTTNADPGPTTPSPAFDLDALTWTTAVVAATGQKLCGGSALFQTHLRQSVALWFIWFLILFYWLIYLCTDSTTKTIYNKEKFNDNTITCWSLYSITQLAHEQFFTRLSRLSVILIQWSVQGTLLAAIIAGAYSTGPAVMVWAPIVVAIMTSFFPFVWGHVFLHKIYKRSLLKYVTQKKMAESDDKQKNAEYEARINACNQKLYGYFHWFYAVGFMLFWTCWPLTINRLTSLPRNAYEYNWYWLVAMLIIFVLEYLVIEPLLICFLGHTTAIKRRGGYWYDPHLGQAYSEVNDS